MTVEESSKEAYAYTPGLKVKQYENIVKERRLPLLGEVLVDVGDEVSFDTIVARTSVPGDPYIIRACHALNIETDELSQFVTKKEGDLVKKGDVVAQVIALFGLFKKTVKSPYDGTIETISEISGQIVVRGPPKPVVVSAYIPGKISKVLPDEGVIVETNGAFIQGIFGVGSETHGMIKMLVDSPEDVLTVESISPEDKGRILVGGSYADLGALRKAVEVGAAGLVVGGLSYLDIVEFMGEIIGVAITGQEDLGLTVIVTEGIGKMSMSHRTFNLLKRFNGYMASINGATQIRAGVIRPEIIISYSEEKEESTSTDAPAEGMKAGTPIRIIRDPYFGLIGKVSTLPVTLQKIKTESHVRVLEVELEDGNRVIVPRANVEIIEE